MRHLAAYLLLVLGGKEKPTADDIKGVLKAAGIDGDDARIATLIKELDGKNLEELIKDGNEKLAKFGGGGGGGGGGGAAAPAAGGEAAAAPAAAPEPEEESEEEMELDLFG
eukprot:TRINITY_DN2957_c0_g3_i1.p3 TRINITY_DN2957_c0_g3~~TRINITY_DN2957_c0_g3_i1.p3  ORF type:complete len:111 (+),score=43.90 TRINITY_DN2957_c0_g3_i1:29-361(+)